MAYCAYIAAVYVPGSIIRASVNRRTRYFCEQNCPEAGSAVPHLLQRVTMPKRTIRLAHEIDERLQSTAKLRGFANASAFMRAAIDNEIRGREDSMAEAEQRLAGNMDLLRKEFGRLARAQQALFAYMDSWAKIFLTCVPEPGGDQMDVAVARARGRHTRLLKNAGQAMNGESQFAFKELVDRGER